MANSTQRTEVVAPYVMLDDYIAGLRYRSAPSAKFQEVESSSKSIFVSVDDLRSIPRHEISIILDESQLHKIYAKHLEKLALLVLTRDNVLKKEHVLYQSPLASLPDSFVLDQERLKQTAARADLALEISVCAVALNGGASGWPKRRGSRLTTWYLNLTNHSKGPRFPWIRKTAEEFKAKGLPANTTFYVHPLGEAAELVSDGDSTVEELLEVWVHEEAWVILQQTNASLGVAAIQRMLVCSVVQQIFELIVPPLSQGSKLEEKSVGRLLIEFVADQAKVESQQITDLLLKKKSTAEVAPIVYAAFGVNKSMKQVISD